MTKVYLGTVTKEYKNEHVAGATIYLTKHVWDCGWYWAFGYIGNRDLHTHFDSAFLTEETNVNNIFSDTKLSQNTWWVLRDLFIQAYALKKCAEVYRNGGYQTHAAGVTDIIRNKELEVTINADLKKVLDKIWEVVTA